MISIDPTRCPICREPNVCAMEKAKATGRALERCWCMDAVFAPVVMDQVPEVARGKACICIWDGLYINWSGRVRIRVLGPIPQPGLELGA